MNEPWSLPLPIMPGVQGGEYTDVFTPQSAEQAPAGGEESWEEFTQVNLGQAGAEDGAKLSPVPCSRSALGLVCLTL